MSSAGVVVALRTRRSLVSRSLRFSVCLWGISDEDHPRRRVAPPRTRCAARARRARSRRGRGGRVDARCRLRRIRLRLSTCNRTELYIAHDSEQDAGDAARALLLEREPALADALYQLQDEAAALHLFRVAAGLDSLVPGEGEILGQVRLAFEAGAAGPMLGRLFRQALYAGRRARVQTGDRRGPGVDLLGVAALAHQVFGDLRGRRILLVGAGKVSEQAARNLLSRGAEIAIVANRSSARAEELAGTFGASAIGLDRIDDELASADIVVASTSAPELVVSRDQVERALRARRGKPLLLVDLAVPRDLDPEIELSGCYLYDLDDLDQVVTQALHRSSPRGQAAESLVAEEAERFRRVAGVARRGACDRVASCVGGGDPAT